ncbi:uncharacterized protein [Asterias amurensis]|uniref:uncharacterized protein n=1 Tax=Asterias amurensis TaxID=7602 RepID=UPI003AB60E74
MSEYRHDRREQGRHRGGQDDHDEMPELYSIFHGEVASIQAYGAFVKIPGFKKNGLVHKTQISSTRVEDVTEILEIGDRVYCKVISLGEDGNGKISLSMKVVNQGNGNDQDPNLVLTKQEEQRRKKGGSFVQPKIELGAVLNTVCRKCGTKGHLAQDCFKTPGGKSYELLGDEDLSLPSIQEAKTPSAHQKKKKKKEKKKKSKKSRHRSSSSDSSSSDSDIPHDKHRHKTKKSKKRRHRSASSDSSSSDSDTPHDKHRHKTKKSKKSRHRSKSSDSSSSDSDIPHDKHRHKTPQAPRHTPRESINQRRKSRHSESSSDPDEVKRHSQKNRHQPREDKSFKQQVSRSDHDKYIHHKQHDSRDRAEMSRKHLGTQDRKRSSKPDSETSSDEHSNRHPKRERQAENSSHRNSQRTEQRFISKSSHDNEKHCHDHRGDRDFSFATKR